MASNNNLSFGWLLVRTFTLHHFIRYLRVHVPIEGINCSLHSSNFLSLLVRNVEPEVLLHCHYQLHGIQRIESQFLKGGRAAEFGLVALGRRFEHLEHFGLNFFKKGDLGRIRRGGEGEARAVVGEGEAGESGGRFCQLQEGYEFSGEHRCLPN